MESLNPFHDGALADGRGLPDRAAEPVGGSPLPQYPGVPAVTPSPANSDIVWLPTPFPPQGEEIVTAELVVLPPPKPRVWTALVVAVASIPTTLVISGIVGGLGALMLLGPQELRRQAMSGEFLQEFIETRAGLLLTIVPGQLVFLSLAVGASLLSPRPWAERLGLRLGVLPLWTWPVFIVATPLIGVISNQLISLVFDDLSENLKILEQMMRTHARDFLPGLLVLVAVMPGIVEELMFRGYLQTRLLERWHPLAAVAVSAAIFCAAHWDPVHVLGVVPLGLWLGTIAWRTDSVWPAMLCHAANNAVAVVGTAYGENEATNWQADPVAVGAVFIGGPALLLSLLFFYFAPPVRRRCV
jgi:membrane protease YdiL (CAAX protease family)